MKTITLNRQELVWQTRQNTWTEEDFKRLLDWLKGFMDKKPEGSWERNHQAEYEVLSQFTWDQIVAIFEKGSEEDEMMIPHYYEAEGEPAYRTSIEETIRDYMREDNYDCDVIDEEYADDYYEDFRVSEVKDDAASEDEAE